MDEFSRPATLEDLKVLISALNKHQVDYLLIGGYALLLTAITVQPPISTCWFPPRAILASESSKP